MELESFFNNQYLHDCLLVNQTTSQKYFCHSIVLGSNSHFINNHMKKHKKNNQTLQIIIPPRIKTKQYSQQDTHDLVFENSVQFFYQQNKTTQQLNSLQMSSLNCVDFMALMKQLDFVVGVQLVRSFIIDKVVGDDNVVDLVYDFYLLDDTELVQYSSDRLAASFDRQIDKNQSKINELPFQLLLTIIKSQSLNVRDENQIFNFIVNYIQSREQCEDFIQPSIDHHPSQQPQHHTNQQQDNKQPENKEEEKKEEEEKKDEQQNEEKKEEQNKDEHQKEEEKKEEEKKDEQQNEEKKEDEKNNTVQVEQVQSDSNEKSYEKMKKYKLSNQQKEKLFLAINLQNVSHQEIRKACNLECLKDFKLLFLEALSLKLNQFEQYDASQVKSVYNFNTTRSQKTQRDQGQQMQQGRNLKRPDPLQDRFMNYDDNLNYQMEQKIQTDPVNQLTQKRGQMANSNMENYENNNRDNQVMIEYDNLTRPNHLNSNRNNQNSMNRQNDDPFMRGSQQMNNQYYNNEQNFIRNKKINQWKSQVSNVYQSHGGQMNNRQQQYKEYVEFKYQSDFDHNGVIYFLGTVANSQDFLNPHNMNLVQNFSSQLRSGQISDLTNRQINNITTQNSKNSFVGIDLLENRYLVPSCYTIRNRPSSTHVMLNWILEGSCDGDIWFMLDKRINYSQDQELNSLMSKEIEALKVKGASSTWGIDSTVVDAVLQEINYRSNQNMKGFRYFRIFQIMKNSHNSYNLCISGIELYGKGYGTGWSL